MHDHKHRVKCFQLPGQGGEGQKEWDRRHQAARKKKKEKDLQRLRVQHLEVKKETKEKAPTTEAFFWGKKRLEGGVNERIL